MFADSRVRWVILKTCLEERLVYRGDFAFSTLVRFLPIVTQIFLWQAIFGDDTNRAMFGYRFGDMVAYFLLAMVGRAFSSMPGLAGGIARDIRDGSVKKFLTQPIDMLGYLFLHRIAHKLVYYIVATGPFALVFWLCREYFPGWPDGWTIAAFVVSLLLAFLVGFFLEALIGLAGFWFLEISSVVFIFMMINYFLSGHMIPLDFFGDPIAPVIKFLPFKYLAYFPATIMLGRYSHAELARELAVEVGWVIVLFVTCRVMFARGVRRYSAFGG